MSALLNQLRAAIRTRHFSRRTEEAYVRWAYRYIRFHGTRHPANLGAREIGAYLSHLAVKGEVAASTQNQALAALLFLYREVLDREVGELEGLVHAKKPVRLPVVMTRDEVRRTLAHVDGIPSVVLRLLYGSGLRLLEALRLRVKDLDFEERALLVRAGKGAKDRITMLPDQLLGPLSEHLRGVRALHQRDLASGIGGVYLPFALERKYPRAPVEWGWQWVFPSARHSTAPRSAVVRRHHLSESPVQRAMTMAVRAARSPLDIG